MTEDQKRAARVRRDFIRAIHQRSITATTRYLSTLGLVAHDTVYRIVADLRDSGDIPIVTIRAGWHGDEWVPECYYTTPRNLDEWHLYMRQRRNTRARSEERDHRQLPAVAAMFGTNLDAEILELLTSSGTTGRA